MYNCASVVLNKCSSWDVVVGVLGHIICDRRKPVFGDNYKVCEPRVEKLWLPCRSRNDDVQCSICGGVGWYISDAPRIEKILTLNSKISQNTQCQIFLHTYI